MKGSISILETEIDDIKKVWFYFLYGYSVIGIGSVVYPYTKDAYIQEGFVKEEFRKKGIWKKLYDARCEWIRKHCPVKDFILYVNKDNPMKAVYERYGFETYKSKGKIAKTKDGSLWMRKKIEK